MLLSPLILTTLLFIVNMFSDIKIRNTVIISSYTTIALNNGNNSVITAYITFNEKSYVKYDGNIFFIIKIYLNTQSSVADFLSLIKTASKFRPGSSLDEVCATSPLYFNVKYWVRGNYLTKYSHNSKTNRLFLSSDFSVLSSFNSFI